VPQVVWLCHIFEIPYENEASSKDKEEKIAGPHYWNLMSGIDFSIVYPQLSSIKLYQAYFSHSCFQNKYIKSYLFSVLLLIDIIFNINNSLYHDNSSINL
jgi:hypothetical protein